MESGGERGNEQEKRKIVIFSVKVGSLKKLKCVCVCVCVEFICVPWAVFSPDYLSKVIHNNTCSEGRREEEREHACSSHTSE